MTKIDVSHLSIDELSPKVLSSRRAYLFWAILYSVIHLAICGYMLVIQPPVGSVLYKNLTYAMMVSLYFFLSDLYLRQIWFPYRREMRRRSVVPDPESRKHPYDFKRKMMGLALSPGIFVLLAGLHFLWFERYSHNRLFPLVLPALVLLPPITYIGSYKSYFDWEEG